MSAPAASSADVSRPGSAKTARIATGVRRSTIVAIATANVVGAIVVICFAVWALPKPVDLDAPNALEINVAVGIGYALLALVVGVAWGRWRIESGPDGMANWFEEERAPSTSERRRALQAPREIMRVQAVLWGLAALVFLAINLAFSGLLALGVTLTVALGGMTTSVAAYLLCELSLRPVAGSAMSAGDDPRPARRMPRLATRWLLAWSLGTGVPVLGLLLVGVVALTPVPIKAHTLAVTTVTLCAIGLTFGAVVSLLAALATVGPVEDMRDAIARVRGGDLHADVEVRDTTEIGQLQLGFNDMAAGLRERERMRDLFGRQVGEDVARQALREEVRLGGERREVVALFVDIVGSTSLAESRSPEEVVDLLNSFFAVVVRVVEQHGGAINKFEGDAALAVFGAPLPLDDAPARALACAREMGQALSDEVEEVRAGIGVAAGSAVAGNIGAESRFEYTVIGDPINQAARLTELAKDQPAGIVTSQETLQGAGEEERDHWEVVDEVTLRGRRQPTAVAALRSDAG